LGNGERIALALRLARRELRGGIRSLRIVLACLALGVAAIAAVGTLRAGIAAGLAADGARILGGDLELRSGARPASPEALDWIAARGGQVSAVVTMRSMLVAAASGERTLVELKAVDGAYRSTASWCWTRQRRSRPARWRSIPWWRSASDWQRATRSASAKRGCAWPGR
jgi:putative ABC transport system permease protein